MMKRHQKWTKEDVFEFLDGLRDSGAVNMFGATPHVVDRFGVSHRRARKLLVEWMETYNVRHASEE